MPYKRLSEQEIQEMKDYKEAGFSHTDIAREMNVDLRTVAKYVGKKYSINKSTDEMIQKMQKLRDEQGLSNSQIALDLGVSTSTVTNHIGKQKDMSKAQYGSLVSHVTGTTFAKEEKMYIGKLKQTKTSVSWDGKDFSYHANTDGQVRITSPTGTTMEFDKEQFLNFSAEIYEICSWLNNNIKEKSTMLNHQ